MTAPISFGHGIPDDSVLRLCGDVGDGRRVLELGISAASNSLAVALAGGKALAVDPDADRLARLRADAAAAQVHVECHQADLADLGFMPSASTEVVVADHTLGAVADLDRVLRQVHRVLRPSAVLVTSTGHPFSTVRGDDAFDYGRDGPTIGDWFTLFERANFRIDRLHELGAVVGHGVPTTLVVRGRKVGS